LDLLHATSQEREARILEIIERYTKKLQERTAHHMGWVPAQIVPTWLRACA
jgi:imidazoleglycerol phosphate synthase glutamine amidotransferase subunit HisH